MNTLQRRAAAGLLVLTSFVGFAGSANAAGAAEKVEDYNVRYETDLFAVDNPCTPEFDNITLEGYWHTVGKRWDYADGSWRYQGSNRGQLSGTAADGDAYRGNVHFQAHTREGDGVVTITADEKHMLIGQGDVPNFTIRLKVHVTFAVDGSFSTYEVLKEGADCRG